MAVRVLLAMATTFYTETCAETHVESIRTPFGGIEYA
jgi:hypothetical protein